MGTAGTEGRARELAGALLRSARAGARLGAPIPVRDGTGGVESWFVPVVDGGRLAGYVRVGTTASYAELGGPPPPAETWTDPDTVRRAAAGAGHDVTGTPYLGYDGVPARLAWVVPVADGVVYVAGDSVWR